jgi:hypothetical protein
MSENKFIGVMKSYLDDTYGGMDCKVTPDEVTWYKDGKLVAGLTRENPRRLKLSSSEFYGFIKTFGLTWDYPTDEMIRELIYPYLNFNGGSPAIPVLIDMGFIDEIIEIALPSNWN